MPAASRAAKRQGSGAPRSRSKPAAAKPAPTPKRAPADAPSAAPLVAALHRAYPDAACALTHHDPFQLLIATILSAQCTDARVNIVTPVLFAAFPDAASMSRAGQEEIEAIIRSTGFFRNKAKSIRGASARIVSEFGGRVPSTMEELLTLPGVARKTANVVLGVGFGIAVGVVVDTHVERLSRRLGLSKGKNAVAIEQELMRVVPREEWIAVSHLLIDHGRQVCQARKPACARCPVTSFCPSARYFLAGKTPPAERKK
ncbi:MAG TPA: endonuclease III [Candidatus Eisenbacteria bacterium]|nr:endonuclease III [Candidatus Eisenbacteria bacterium]